MDEIFQFEEMRFHCLMPGSNTENKTNLITPCFNNTDKESDTTNPWSSDINNGESNTTIQQENNNILDPSILNEAVLNKTSSQNNVQLEINNTFEKDDENDINYCAVVDDLNNVKKSGVVTSVSSNNESAGSTHFMPDESMHFNNNFLLETEQIYYMFLSDKEYNEEAVEKEENYKKESSQHSSLFTTGKINEYNESYNPFEADNPGTVEKEDSKLDIEINNNEYTNADLNAESYDSEHTVQTVTAELWKYIMEIDKENRIAVVEDESVDSAHIRLNEEKPFPTECYISILVDKASDLPSNNAENNDESNENKQTNRSVIDKQVTLNNLTGETSETNENLIMKEMRFHCLMPGSNTENKTNLITPCFNNTDKESDTTNPWSSDINNGESNTTIQQENNNILDPSILNEAVLNKTSSQNNVQLEINNTFEKDDENDINYCAVVDDLNNVKKSGVVTSVSSNNESAGSTHFMPDESMHFNNNFLLETEQIYYMFLSDKEYNEEAVEKEENYKKESSQHSSLFTTGKINEYNESYNPFEADNPGTVEKEDSKLDIEINNNEYTNADLNAESYDSEHTVQTVTAELWKYIMEIDKENRIAVVEDESVDSAHIRLNEEKPFPTECYISILVDKASDLPSNNAENNDESNENKQTNRSVIDKQVTLNNLTGETSETNENLIMKGKRCFICKTCGRKYINERVFIKHQAEGHASKRCSICSLVFHSIPAMIKHEQTHFLQRIFKCNYKECNCPFKLAHHLSKHMKKIHHQLVRYHCKVCSTNFSSSHDLQQHISQSHGIIERNFQCFCNKKFKIQRSLRRHYYETHNDDGKKVNFNTYRCETCGKILKKTTNIAFSQHIMKNHKNKTIKTVFSNLITQE